MSLQLASNVAFTPDQQVAPHLGPHPHTHIIIAADARALGDASARRCAAARRAVPLCAAAHRCRSTSTPGSRRGAASALAADGIL